MLTNKPNPISSKGRTRFIRVAAGLTAVLVSPFISAGISEKAAGISTIVSSAVEYMEKSVKADTSEPLLMKSEALLLYKPGGDNTVIKEQIHIPSPNMAQTNETVEETGADEDETVYVMSRNIIDEEEDLSSYTAQDGEIVKTTFKANNGTNFINLPSGGQIRNVTELSNEDILEEIENKPDFTIQKNGEPEVLIIHTHASESYQPTESNYYDAEYISRSVDPDNNVIAVGTEIAKSIARQGIAVIHDGTMHDMPEYNGAYNRSAQTVETLLEEFPSIKVVLDIHRDAIAWEDGTLVSPVVNVDGKDAAQVMIIAACGDSTYYVPEYRKNLRFAALLQSQMEQDNPGITRPVLFQYCQYNQHLSTGSLLIEVGAHGNTLEQAKLAGRLIGESIGATLISLM